MQQSDQQPTASEPTLAETLSALPRIECVTTPTLNTATAALYLGRKPQTLRRWAALENGPLRPVRMLRSGGGLAWRVIDICRLLGVAPENRGQA